MIVENKEIQLQGLKADLETIEPDRREQFGIEDFDIDLARTVDDAERSLLRTNGKPYDFMLLDLGIPLTKYEHPDSDNVENGQRLLVKARTTATVKEIVVVSAFPEFKYAARAFRNGAMDFVPKPFKTMELQTRVMECWKRLLQKDSNYILGDRRIRDLVPYAEKGLAHRFNSCLADFERTVAHTSEDLEKEMRERFGLDRSRNADDFIFRRLNDQRVSIINLKKKWTALNASLKSETESDETAALELLLKEIHQALLPAFVVKNLTLDFIDEGATRILTFENDVQAVLKEILAGAATAVEDFDEEQHPIIVRVANVDEQVRVSFEDQLKPIRALEHINEDAIVPPFRENFDRAWGLSVVQHIAKGSGGRIEIRPHPNGKGNVVNYFVSSAQ